MASMGISAENDLDWFNCLKVLIRNNGLEIILEKREKLLYDYPWTCWAKIF